MSHWKLPILLITLFSLVIACKNASDKAPVEHKEPTTDTSLSKHATGDTLFQATWEKAIAERNLSLIDSLINNDCKFKVQERSCDCDISADTLSSPLMCLFYWSLNETRSYISQSFNSEYRLQSLNTYLALLQNKDDHLFGSNVDADSVDDDIFTIRRDPVRKKQLSDSLRIEIDSLNKELTKWEDSCMANLVLLEYTLKKGCRLTSSQCARILYLSDHGWWLRDITAKFFYDRIYGRSNYFAKDEYLKETISPDIALLCYIGAMQGDQASYEKMIRYLFSKGVNKSSFLKDIYPNIEEEDLGPDDPTPCYEAEKVLYQIMPNSLEKHSGHNLLHTAIVNIDIGTIKELVNKDRSLLNAKTKPIHPYLYYSYGKKPYTPIELAKFKLRQWERESKESLASYFGYKFRIQQIKKILSFLEKETATTIVENEL